MRTDVHRPSVIEPEDYEFVCFNYLKVEDLGSAMFLAEERARREAHMKRTGGWYSSHEHGGNCAVCGNANAIYTALFYHRKTNSYVRTGLDCAEKLECHGVEAFKTKVIDALEHKAGKAKAKKLLELAGVPAWEVVEAVEKRRVEYAKACEAWRAANPEPKYVPDGPYGVKEVGAPVFKLSKEEETVEDIVGKLVKYGSVSDKTMNYLGVLVDRIKRAPEIEAARAAEAEAAKPIPEFKGRAKIKGKVLTVKLPEEYAPFPSKKMLVKHSDGWKVWGTVPASIAGELERGDEVEFVATVKVSDRDPKFGFISRPANAKILKEAA